MNTRLISAAEVLELAFPTNEYVAEETIVPARIETAQLKFLQPAFGPLYEKLDDQRYGAFVQEYVKPALAYYVRCLMIDERCASIGTVGILQNKTSYAEAAGDDRLNRLRRQALSDAHTLLDKATGYVENNPAMFPEYDPKKNIRKKIRMKGGFIL